MGAEAKTDRLEGALLALLEHEERLARWESLLTAASGRCLAACVRPAAWLASASR